MKTKSRIFVLVSIVMIVLIAFVGSAAARSAHAPRDAQTVAARTDYVSSTPGYWKSFRKPDDATLRAQLSQGQYQITQESGTEQPFKNEYSENHDAGIYVDIVSGEPLFSSRDKYDSGTGWPAFVGPIEEGSVARTSDNQLLFERTEVRSRYADSHLGHVFNDGPVSRGGKRYCINSGALRFVPKDSMASEGYGKYLDSL